MSGRRLDDPDLVRNEYADESRLAVRSSIWSVATGPDAREATFDAVAEAAPQDVLEVGPGRGELSERIARELGARVVAVDQSERMVELTRARGIDARLADVQELPFPDRAFDCAVAAWMLYHVPDLDRGLAELARVLRPGGRLVAVTNSESNLQELWELAGGRTSGRYSFSAENGHISLGRHFERVERRDIVGTAIFADYDAALAYVRASVTRAHLAERLPRFDGPLVCTRRVAVFVAEAPT